MIDKENIELENVYNMDESGFAISDVEASQHIINAAICQKFQAKPGHQEWVMAIECICADGTSIPSLIIFKGAGTGPKCHYRGGTQQVKDSSNY